MTAQTRFNVMAVLFSFAVFASILIQKGQNNGHDQNTVHGGSGDSILDGDLPVLRRAVRDLAAWKQESSPVRNATRSESARSANEGRRRPLLPKGAGGSHRRENPNTHAPAYLDLLSGPGLEATLDYIWAKESSCGKDPLCWPGRIGPKGEKGEWQWTRIFERDLIRLKIAKGKAPDPYGPDCRKQSGLWLQMRANEVEWRSIYDLHNLYKRGVSGYRAWQDK